MFKQMKKDGITYFLKDIKDSLNVITTAKRLKKTYEYVLEVIEYFETFHKCYIKSEEELCAMEGISVKKIGCVYYPIENSKEV